MAHLKSGVELRPMRVCGVLGARLGVDTSLFSGQDTETAAPFVSLQVPVAQPNARS